MNQLEKLLDQAFENKGGKNHYQSGDYEVGFEDRAFETLFWVYENNVCMMEGNTFDKNIQFNLKDCDFEKYIRAVKTVLPEYSFTGEVYEEYLENQNEQKVNIQVYSIHDQDKFNVGMAVGHMTAYKGKYEKEVEDWTYDIELAGLAKVIYDKADGDYRTSHLKKLIDEYFSGGYDTEDLPFLENGKTKEEYREYLDLWSGVECGAFYGFANKSSLQKSDKAMKAFMNQMTHGFVHEVIEEMMSEKKCLEDRIQGATKKCKENYKEKQRKEKVRE